MQEHKCPACSSLMEFKELKKKKVFKGLDIEYSGNFFVCPGCSLEAGDAGSAGEVQRAIADAYREKAGLLTGREIRELRDFKGMTQEQLSRALNVGVASIKRWESGMVQSRSMDGLLRRQLKPEPNPYTGNRETSLPRIKLVAQTLEKILSRQLLKEGDRFLFLGKYLWYADMLAFRRSGRGLTGASYAALPYGPQLNNYRDLVEPINNSDIADAEPLSREEHAVIHYIAECFPYDRDIYDASHKEKVWYDAPAGSLISYLCAYELTQIPEEA